METGSIEVRPSASERRSVVELSEEQIGQLALRLGAALKPVEEKPARALFGELVSEWLESIRAHRVVPENEERLARRLLPLYLEDEDTLTVAMVTECLQSLKGELGASTINKVRGVGRLTVEYAANPFALVRRQKELPRQYELLTLEELAKVQLKLTPPRRREFRVALHLGLRTGELLALRKEDVDFDRAVVRIRRSHERDETKTGRERVIPLLDAVAGDLLAAKQTSFSELLFPGEGGALQRRDTKLTRVLRTAMAAARVGLERVTYKCRSIDCSPPRVGPPPVVRQECERCGCVLWPVVTVRAVRWYDLRHMCATFHHYAGADTLAISMLLGHSPKGTTSRIYTHLDDGTLRRELSRWQLPTPAATLMR